MMPTAAVKSLVLVALAAGANAFAQTTASPQGAASAAPASAPAAARPSNGGPSANAVQACELAVRSTLRNTRGVAAEISFNAPPAASPGVADGGEVLLRGAGRAKSGGSARTFTYSCTYDTKSDSFAGVVLRDAAPASDRATAVASPVRTVEPDLSQISPAACESAAASALKRRWPNVGRIAFNADTRSLVQDSAGTAKLEGQGTAQPQPSSELSAHFRYQCALDAANGRVLALRLVD